MKKIYSCTELHCSPGSSLFPQKLQSWAAIQEMGGGEKEVNDVDFNKNNQKETAVKLS